MTRITTWQSAQEGRRVRIWIEGGLWYVHLRLIGGGEVERWASELADAWRKAEHEWHRREAAAE